MTDTTPSAQNPITLPTHLVARREALLHIWKTACDTDASLVMNRRLSTKEFNDHAPGLLDCFGQQLQGHPSTEDLQRQAAQYSLHRWQKGYTLRELLGELNHLSQCLATEITAFETLYPPTERTSIPKAYELAMRFSTHLISGSVEQYNALERNQAAERADMLQQALDTVMALTRQRGELLRMTSHDLRGSLGVIRGAASLLSLPDANEEKRADRLQMLLRNLVNAGDVLSQLTDLSRLEAGQETVALQPVDACTLLQSIVESAQPLAAERGLVLRGDGPVTLPVETDPVLLQRIVQNLLLNALQHTRSGLISVAWSYEDNFRWTVSIQDTGTGLPAGLAASLTETRRPTADTAAIFEQPQPERLPAHELPTGSSSGEGIGLHIVKWLCQLLNATIDIETRPGHGTLVRVRLPMRMA